MKKVKTIGMLLIAIIILAFPSKSCAQLSIGIGSGATIQKGSVAASIQLQIQVKAPAEFPVVFSYTQIAHVNRITPTMFQFRAGYDVYKGLSPFVGMGYHLKTSDDKGNPENDWFHSFGIQYDRHTWFINAGYAGKYFTTGIGCHYTFN